MPFLWGGIRPHKIFAAGKDECGCTNLKHCPAEDFVGNGEIWQALIDGKKAQDALKRAKEIYVRDVAWWQCRCDSYDGDELIEHFFDKEITSITKQEV